MDIIGFNDEMSGLFDFIPKINIQKPQPKKMIPNKMVSKTQATKPNLFTAALNKAKQTGQSFMVKTPTGVKKLTPKKPFNIAPTANKIKSNSIKTAMPMQSMQPVQNEIRSFENSLQNLPAAKQAQAIFNAPVTPSLVEQLTPIQRSFLKTDLPYKILSPNNYGQPSTQKLQNTPLKFSIDIDQIQPAVDSGISNYYGK